MRSCLLACFGLVLAACGQPDSATGQPVANANVMSGTESYREFGDYVLHFNALTTDRLPGAVAAEHDIVRSTNRAMLNISILRNQEIGVGMPVPGEVTASARNLTGQLKDIAIREIREGDAIYYIGETAIADGETLIFTVEAIPESGEEPLSVSFRKQFFVDD